LLWWEEFWALPIFYKRKSRNTQDKKCVIAGALTLTLTLNSECSLLSWRTDTIFEAIFCTNGMMSQNHHLPRQSEKRHQEIEPKDRGEIFGSLLISARTLSWKPQLLKEPLF